MGSPHTILPRLLEADHTITDPGTGKAIAIDKDMGVLELMIAAGATETNTLAAPTAQQAGRRLAISVKSFGAAGTRTITGPFKTVAGADKATYAFGAANSFGQFMAMNLDGTMKWVAMVVTAT